MQQIRILLIHFLYLLVLELHGLLLLVLNQSQPLEALLLDVFLLILLQVVVRPERVEHSGLVGEHSVRDGDNRIVIPKRSRIHVAAEQVGYVHLLTVLHVENEDLLHQGLLDQHGLDVEQVNEVAEANDEPDFIQLKLISFAIVFVAEEHAGRALFVQVHLSFLILLHLCILVDVAALFFLE